MSRLVRLTYAAPKFSSLFVLYCRISSASTWEQRKLGNISEITTGKAFHSSDFSIDGIYKVITNKNVRDKLHNKQFEGDRINLSNESLQKFILHGHNILVTMDGANIGQTGVYNDKHAVLAQRVGRIVASQTNFVYQIVHNSKFIRTMNIKSVGNAIKHISLKQIGDYNSFIPLEKLEREKIGILLTDLDNLIAANEQGQKQTFKITKNISSLMLMIILL
ncbi:restriction endonuclease subunit S [Lactiplantibacillus pentosus]|jgi:type I restriction enzyme S subunit|uniref:restriction endonuclease subunit S n=1 Tax=Lactiplantibacillus pentosus TaxID=1589 RepID=UPI001D000095|nr:restriction endonuclease subunit S [Lactiplantibacillus pentosus]MCB5221746.1 restriction endonuclease subunit S [Lactiplantibacillus pentosus]